jgi:hypothetical protein
MTRTTPQAHRSFAARIADPQRPVSVGKALYERAKKRFLQEGRGYDNAETKERPNLHWLSLAVVVKTTGTKTGAKSVIFLKSPV